MKTLHIITLFTLLLSLISCGNSNSSNYQSQYSNDTVLNEDTSLQIEEIDSSEYISNTDNPLPTNMFDAVAKVYALNEAKDYTYREDVELKIGVFKDGRVEDLLVNNRPLRMRVEVNNLYKENQYHFMCYHLVNNIPKAIYLFNTDKLNITW